MGKAEASFERAAFAVERRLGRTCAGLPAVAAERGGHGVAASAAQCGERRLRLRQGIEQMFGSAPGGGDEAELLALLRELSPVEICPAQEAGTPLRLSGDKAGEALARDLGDHLGAVHRLRFEHWGALQGESRLAPERWPARLAQTLAPLAECDPSARARLPRMQALARALPVPEHFCIVSPGLRPTQFRQREGRIAALAAFDALVIGPRELDLTSVEYALAADQVRPFRAGYERHLPLPRLAHVRAVYRYLHHLLGALGEPDCERSMLHDIRFAT